MLDMQLHRDFFPEPFTPMLTGISHAHSSKRRGEKAGRLALGACQAPWPPAHITPLFHVQAVQDTASSQAEAIIFTLQKHLLLERQNAGQSGEKA